MRNAFFHVRPDTPFGISPQFWVNLQTRFDLEVTEDMLAERLEKEVQVLSSNAA